AAVENRAWRGPAKFALEFDERRSHLRYRRYHGSRLADVLALERPLIEAGRIKRTGHPGGHHNIVEPLAGDLQIMGNRAVDQAGVEMPKPEVSRKALAQGALARSRRPIDGDDHQAPDDFFAKGKWLRARRRGRSSVKILRVRNSPGLAKLRYSRMASLSK